MDGRSEYKNGLDSEKVFYNQYVIPGKKDQKVDEALLFFKNSDKGNTSLIMVLIGVLGFVLLILMVRYIYQRCITDSLHGTSEARFWTKKTMETYKHHPKLQEAIRRKNEEQLDHSRIQL